MPLPSVLLLILFALSVTASIKTLVSVRHAAAARRDSLALGRIAAIAHAARRVD